MINAEVTNSLALSLAVLALLKTFFGTKNSRLGECSMYKEMYYSDDLENLAEEIVFEQIHSLIEDDETDVPDSDVSIQDIAAIALNNMPAKYVCNFLEKRDPGEQLKEEVKDLKKYARRQVLKAIKKVKERPHD